MSSMLKCPNPSCPYVFDPSRVPTGVVLSCPRCGMQFALGAPAAPLAPPVAPPVAASPPVAPVAPGPDAPGRAAPEPPDAGGRYQTLIVALIAAVLMAGTGLALYFKYTGTAPRDTADPLDRVPAFDIGFETPAGWTDDPETKVKVGSWFHLARRHEGPEAYMVFGARETKDQRPPRPSEMAQGLRAPLPKLFDVSTVREESLDDARWLGLAPAPSHAFKFRAQSTDGLVWVGEAVAVASKGVAYYWLSWCGERDYESMQAEFAAFRGKFQLLGNRKWTERASNVVEFKGDQVRYALSDTEGGWRELPARDFEPFKAQEPDLDKVLRLTHAPDRKAVPDVAELRVYVLDAGGDPLEGAKALVRAKEEARVNFGEDKYKIDFIELTDPPQGDPTDAPPNVHLSTPVVRLLTSVQGAKSANRLLVASGVRAGDKLVVAVGWCEAGRRGAFETRLVQVASSLR